MKKFFTALLVLFQMHLGKSFAHVGYVIEKDLFLNAHGNDWEYILSPLLDSLNIFLMVASALAFFIAYIYLPKISIIGNWLSEFSRRSDNYKLYVPLLIRQSLGVLFIALGTQGVLISPVLEATSFISLLEIVTGFMMILGIAIPLSLSMVFMLYFMGIGQNIYLIGNLEIIGLSFAYIFLGDHSPSLDHLLSVPLLTIGKKMAQFAPTILRICLGTAMIFLGFYEKILNPHTSELVAQIYGLTSIIPVSASMWVLSAGLIEIALGLAYVLGLRVRLVSIITMIVLSMTFFFFQEDVSSHVTLFAAVLVSFILGAGSYSLDETFFDRITSEKNHIHRI